VNYNTPMINNQNVPKLRFKEFSGKWEEKKLGDIVTHKSQKYNSEKDKTSYKCIELEHLAPEIGKLLGFSESIEAGSIKNKFSTGDVLFGKLRPYLKKYLQPSFDGVCSSEIWVLKGTGISNNFLFSLIQTKQFIDLANQSSGSKMPRADWSVVSNGIFNIPTSKDEQEKIASFLSAVDTKIDQLTRKKELLEQYKKGVMQKIFSQELRFKDEDGSEFPEWEEKNFCDVFKIGSGKDYKHLESGDIPVYGTGGYMLSVSDYLYEGESVCIGRKGTIDKPMFLDGKFWTVDTLFYTHSFKDSIPKFIFYIFQTINWQLYNEASGVPSLSKSTIEKISFSFPSVQEQTKIANFLTSIDTKIDLVTKQLEEVKQFKKALLQQMFV